MKAVIVSVAIGLTLAGGVAEYACGSDTEYPGIYVKDSVITAKVQTKLVAKHPTLLSNVRVQTDRDGNVWLSGTVPTDEAKHLAEQIASETTGVRSVHNHIVVSPP